ncbi:MAG: ABC transporter ATP-binding protein [Actinomycetota bacterium]
MGGRAPDPVEPPPTAPPPPVDRSTMLASVAAVDKSFGTVQALRGLQIDIPRSKITVLLGPNGAGKTTAIRMITGALGPDRGEVRVFGVDPSGPEGDDVRRRCGVVSAKPSLYDRLDGTDNLRYAAELYGLGRGPSVERTIRDAAARFGIDHALDQQVGGYSTGMKTRLALARSILHDPDLLLLDEPTSGLDPESAQAVLAMVREMTAGDRTVLMCTHLLSEAEGLADEVVIIEAGTTLMWGAPEILGRRYWPRPEVTIQTPPNADLDWLVEHPSVVTGVIGTGRAELQLTAEAAVGDVVAAVVARRIPILAVVPNRPTLEDLYFAVRAEQRRLTEGGEPC